MDGTTPSRTAYQRLRQDLARAVSHEWETDPCGCLRTLADGIRRMLARKPGALPQRIRHLSRLVRTCRQAAAKAPPGLRNAIALTLLNACYDRPGWAALLPCVWEPDVRTRLAGGYQFSLRLAQKALVMVRKLRNGVRPSASTESLSLLAIARAALGHARYGFFQAGPKVRGVRLSRRFAERAVALHGRLARASGREDDRATEIHFLELSRRLLLREAKQKRAREQPALRSMLAPFALREARARPWFHLKDPMTMIH